jgi:predicted transcriptional regulator
MAYLTHELELLDKKAENKKATATQVANEGIMETIKEVLSQSEKAMTVTELMKANDVLGELSNQKVSALLKKLVDSEEVIKSTEGRKSVFTLV